MNYEWDEDPEWKEYLNRTKKLPDGKDQLELARRAYYNLKIVKDFEKTFDFPNEEDRKDYFEYCAFFGNLGSL